MSEGYEALRRGAAWFDLSQRGRIRVSGRDRARLLHAITTNEIKKLTPGAGCYAFLLTPQGRIQGDLTLFAFEDHFLLDTEPELQEKVLAHIKKYIIADQVTPEDVTASTTAVALEGPGAAAVLSTLGAAVPGADYQHLPWGEFAVASVSITGQPGFRIYGGSGQRDEIVRRLAGAGAKEASAEDVRQVRIENGRPRYGEDIRDTSLPQETQLMHAVSFNKGCYLGQEIVERIRAQGRVNKKLVRLEISGSAPLATGTKLTSEGNEAGEITSSVYAPEAGKVVALGYVRTAYAEPGKPLEAEGLAVSVAELVH